MGPLVVICLVLLVLLFIGDILLRAVAPRVASEWSWKERPVLHAVVALVLVTLLIAFNALHG